MDAGQNSGIRDVACRTPRDRPELERSTLIQLFAGCFEPSSCRGAANKLVRCGDIDNHLIECGAATLMKHIDVPLGSRIGLASKEREVEIVDGHHRSLGAVENRRGDGCP